MLLHLFFVFGACKFAQDQVLPIYILDFRAYVLLIVVETLLGFLLRIFYCLLITMAKHTFQQDCKAPGIYFVFNYIVAIRE